MAKKPLKVYSRAQGRMVTAQEMTARMPVYSDSADTDRSSITQMVVEHPPALVGRGGGGHDGDDDGLLHSVYDAVLVADQDGSITRVNARAEHNFVMSGDDLCNMNIVDLISGADQEVLKLVRKNVSNKKFTIFEAVCIRGDETRFDAEIVANRLGDKKQLAFFVRDVTLRRQAEEELRNANERLIEAEKIQARLDTLSTLFHDLNNPLQILTCMAEMDENPEYKKELDRIVSVLDQLRRDESLETVVDDDGGTRYEIPIERDLAPCDASRILVVDDERILQEMFVRALGMSFSDCTADMAGDGRVARDLFREKRHAVVIMDVSMPVMNGEQAFAEIEAICEQDAIQLPSFIFCTGFVISDNLRDVVGDESRHTYLKKPLTMDDLVHTVGTYRERQQGIASGEQTA